MIGKKRWSKPRFADVLDGTSNTIALSERAGKVGQIEFGAAVWAGTPMNNSKDTYYDVFAQVYRPTNWPGTDWDGWHGFPPRYPCYPWFSFFPTRQPRK